MGGVTTRVESAPEASRDGLRASVANATGDPLVRYALGAYVASRLLFFAIAVAHSLIAHAYLRVEMSNWDGHWYLATAAQWYGHTIPTHARQYSTLGFMPLYSALMWLVAKATGIGFFGAGLSISLLFGAVATVLVGRLAQNWWGPAAARRALLFWCLFPGTIVFSMVYTESLAVALVAGALLLMERRRWLAGGLLCGLASAVAAADLSVVAVCVVASLREIHSRGIGLTRDAPLRVLRDRPARRSLIAPLLSPFGAVGFAIYLWIHTGSPLADYTAQSIAWEEKSTPLAVPDAFGSLVHQIFISGVANHGPGGIDLNNIVAVLGTLYLFWALWQLWTRRRNVQLTALVWAACLAVLVITSAKTPPNPRMLVLAFPLVMVVGARFSGRAFRWAMVVNVALTLVMSYFTFDGIWLRP